MSINGANRYARPASGSFPSADLDFDELFADPAPAVAPAAAAKQAKPSEIGSLRNRVADLSAKDQNLEKDAQRTLEYLLNLDAERSRTQKELADTITDLHVSYEAEFERRMQAERDAQETVVKGLMDDLVQTQSMIDRIAHHLDSAMKQAKGPISPIA